MNDFMIEVLSVSTQISALLIISIGCLTVIALLLYPLWYLMSTVLYKRTKGVVYFVQFVRYKKQFIKWYKEQRPDVHKGEVKNDLFK